MGRADWLFCRSRGAIVGANLMKHQSGNETVRAKELGTCGVGCLTRLLPCRNVSVPGIPTPQRFLYPTCDWLVTTVVLDLQHVIHAEVRLLMIIKKTLRYLQLTKKLPLLVFPP